MKIENQHKNKGEFTWFIEWNTNGYDLKEADFPECFPICFCFSLSFFLFMSSVTNVPFELLKENPVLKCDCCSDLGGLSQGATRAKAERGQMFH